MQELIISYPVMMNNYFRIRETPDHPGRLVQSISGMSQVLRTDNEHGRLHVMADIEYTEHVGKVHARLHCDYQAIEDIMVPVDGEHFLYGYWRLCFNRQKGNWRIRNEQEDGETIYVDSYEGVLNHDWYDESAHLYHKGEFIHHEGRAILIPGDAHRPTRVQENIDRISDAYYGIAPNIDPRYAALGL